MPDPENEKSLSGAIDKDLCDQFDSIVFGSRNPKFHKKKLMAAFAKWFIALSEEDRKDFYKLADEPMELSFHDYVLDVVNNCLLSAETVIAIADAIAKKKAPQKRSRRPQRPKYG